MSNAASFTENFNVLQKIAEKLQNKQITDVDEVINDVKKAVAAYDVVMPKLKAGFEELEKLKQHVTESIEDEGKS